MPILTNIAATGAVRVVLKVANIWRPHSRTKPPAHVEEAILNVRSVYIASEELGGLAAYRHR